MKKYEYMKKQVIKRRYLFMNEWYANVSFFKTIIRARLLNGNNKKKFFKYNSKNKDSNNS